MAIVLSFQDKALKETGFLSLRSIRATSKTYNYTMKYNKSCGGGGGWIYIIEKT